MQKFNLQSNRFVDGISGGNADPVPLFIRDPDRLIGLQPDLTLIR